MTYEEMQRMMQFILEQQARFDANMRKLEERKQKLEEPQLLLRKPQIRPHKARKQVNENMRRAVEAVSDLESFIYG